MEKEQIDKIKHILIRLIIDGAISIDENHLLRTLVDECEAQNKEPKVNCVAKPRANDNPELKLCTCYNFCKHDNAQFDSILS